MSSADLILFRQYADEALRWAVQSKNEKEVQALVELARAWTQAAANSPPEYGPCEFRLQSAASVGAPRHLGMEGTNTIPSRSYASFHGRRNKSQCMALERSPRDHVLMGCCGCEHCCDLRHCCS